MGRYKGSKIEVYYDESITKENREKIIALFGKEAVSIDTWLVEIKGFSVNYLRATYELCLNINQSYNTIIVKYINIVVIQTAAHLAI